MTILHIMQCTNLGGMEQVAYRAMEELVRRDGLAFRIATPRPFGPGRDRVLALDPEARDFPYRGRFGWRDFPAFRRHVHALAEGCSHIWVTGPSAAGIAAILDLPLPKILSYHNHHFEGRLAGLKWRAFYELLCHQFAAIAYPTAFTRGEATHIAPWIAAQSAVVPNGYDLHYRDEADREIARARARQCLGLPDDTLVVGNAGWLIARKRFDVFLETAALVARALPETQFVICGDGPLRGALEAHARELGIADRVRFKGWVTDLADYYRAWDILLFNSDFDTLPCAPMEAASYGCPTVGSLVYGGLSEFIDHSHNGFLFKDHDRRAMADAIVSLARNPGLASQLRAAARETLATRFSRDRGLAFYRSFFKGAENDGKEPIRGQSA